MVLRASSDHVPAELNSAMKKRWNRLGTSRQLPWVCRPRTSRMGATRGAERRSRGGLDGLSVVSAPLTSLKIVAVGKKNDYRGFERNICGTVML